MSRTKRRQVAFGSWKCNCTMLAAQIEEIPSSCPVHGGYLLGPRSWELVPSDLEFGIRPDHRIKEASR